MYPYSKTTEHIAIAGIWMNFGAMLGLLFPENDGLGALEVTCYYIEHIMCATVGTLVLSMCGRFDILAYANGPCVILGQFYWVLYMRWFLMPVSALTWANLNHTLCNVEFDPL